MKKRIEVKTQAEFDACVNEGNTAVVMEGRFVAYGSASVEAYGSASVKASGSASVKAYGSASVLAYGSASVVAYGSAFIRLFSALRIKASAHVVIMMHGTAQEIVGGTQVPCAPAPVTGADWCEAYGLDPDKADYKIPNIDAAIFEAIESGKAKGLQMSSWHGDDLKCDETNWCQTTHCRAGYAICLAGKAGFELEKKYGPEEAGKRIYAVSRPDLPLPDFHASDEIAMEDIRRCAGVALSEGQAQ
ncbi:MAG: hypothetical protein ACRCXM_02585 [Beijerinckiaceae bacterium]